MYRFKCPTAVNPHHISEHDKHPKMVYDKMLKEKELEISKRKTEYEMSLKGAKKANKKDFGTYFTLPDKLVNVSAPMKDTYANTQKFPDISNKFLDKDEYTTSVLQMAR